MGFRYQPICLLKTFLPPTRQTNTGRIIFSWPQQERGQEKKPLRFANDGVYLLEALMDGLAAGHPPSASEIQLFP
jgi:hypothetical protein